jgi:hypothetical protein
MRTSIDHCKVSATRMVSFLFVWVLLVCAASVALAQAGRGSISGLVSDPSGAIVPGARIALLNEATGVAQHSVTTAAGLYSFVSLNPGVYKVTASMKGFESIARDKIAVTVDQVTTVNIALRVGSVSEVVTVAESTSLVETSNSTVGQLISSETINRVPLLTRNVYDLVQLSAGVTPANGSPNSSSSEAIINISSGRPGVDVSSYTSTVQSSAQYIICSTAVRLESPRTMPPPSSRHLRFPRMAWTSIASRPRTLPPPIRVVEQASSAWSANPAETGSMGTPLGFSAQTFLPPMTTLISGASC